MRRVTAAMVVMLVFGAVASAADKAGKDEASPKPEQREGDSDAVQWRARCDFDDGRRFLTDGGLLLESRFVPKAPAPEKSVAPAGAERLLRSETDHEFGLSDLERKADGGHYVAPGSIQLNRKYVELLRGSPLKSTLRLRGKGRNDPVLILDGKKVVGVMMPMKS